MSDKPATDVPNTLDTIRKWTRDLFIIIGVIILIVYPSLIGRFLKEAKLQLTYDEGAKTWTVTAAEENRNLANQISELTTQAQALQQQVEQVGKGKTDPPLS